MKTIPAQSRGRLFWWGLAGLCAFGIPLHASSSHDGSLNVTVQDENGDAIQNAQVYICGQRHGRWLQVEEARPKDALALAPGEYRIFAGLSKPIADSVDHYASPEARVRINADDVTSVILVLHRGDDLVMTESHLKRMGLDPDLAKTLN